MALTRVLLILVLALTTLQFDQCAPLPLFGGSLQVNTPNFDPLPIDIYYYVPTIAASNDILVYYHAWGNDTSNYFGIVVARRNESGLYDIWAYIDDQDFILQYQLYPGYLDSATNGEWIAMVYNRGPYQSYTNFLLFRVAENGTIIDLQLADTKGYNFYFARFLSDGSVVGVSNNENLISVPRLHTFKLINGTWTLVDVSLLNNAIRTSGAYLDRDVMYVHPIFALTDNEFIATDNANIFIYNRLVNGSWTLGKQFAARGGTTSSISYNGVDAILTGMPKSNQFVLYQKTSNGTWDGSVVVTSADAGYTNAQMFGIASLSVNADTFLVLAPNARDSYLDASGRILMLQRYNGQWYLSGQLLTRFAEGSFRTFSLFNLVATNDQVLFANNTGLFSLPLCTFEPMTYQCPSQITLDTCKFGEFDVSKVCNSTQPKCGSDVTTVQGLNIGDNSMTIDFTVNRFGSSPLSSSVTIQCKELSSGGGPNSSPSSSIPSSSSVPVANVPGITPNGGSQVTSGADSNDLISVFAIILALISIVC